MKKKDIFFVSLFTVAFLVSAVIMAGDHLLKSLEKSMDSYPLQHSSEEIAETTEREMIAQVDQETKSAIVEVTEMLPEEEEQAPLEFETVDKDYFDDALFVGDSRTVGIMEYGGLENAAFFADSGMSVYGLEFKKISVPDVGKVTFEELLDSRQFGKIYLMLGLNELGYRFDATEQKYKDTVDKIREQQEDAIIYLCANMHVTEEQSEKDKIYNNTNVNQMNDLIESLADNETIFYIDVNELFDDETGSLSTEYSSDAFHVYGKHYVDWVDWLCTKAINISE